MREQHAVVWTWLPGAGGMLTRGGRGASVLEPVEVLIRLRHGGNAASLHALSHSPHFRS